MSSLHRDISSLGQLAATHELHARGHSQTRLRLAVSHGEILRIRKGWYSLPDLAEPLQRAARVGGRLSCVTAAIELGLWVPSGPELLHVSVRRSACQLRTSDNYRLRLAERRDHGVVIHWHDDRLAGSRAMVDATTAIEVLCRCQSAEFAFVVCESARNSRMLTALAWESVLRDLPVAKGRALARAGSLSQSGTESMFAYRMTRLGVHFRQQVQLGVDRVDFLIGERLVIEIDSLKHHDPTQDCIRDARLSILGYRVLRFMYSQVTGQWGTVRDSVFAAMSRGDHRAP